MVGSIDSLDFSPELTISKERNSIPINCWQDVCLSNIWIPSSLLPSRKKPSNNRITKGIFHTLEKRDSAKCIKSFSVYSDEEIFLSDSDEDILGSCNEIEKQAERLSENASAMTAGFFSGYSDSNYNEKDITDGSNQHYKSKQYEDLEIKERISNLKAMPSVDNLCGIGVETTSKIFSSHEKLNIKTEQHKVSTFKQEMKRTDSHISLNEILDNTPEINITDFKNKDNEFCYIQEKKLESNHKKNNNLHISLNKILDNTPEINITDFKNKDKEFCYIQEKKLESNHKKNKKKSPKYITLEEFLEDYEEADYQTDCCNDYFRKILKEKNKSDIVQIRSTAEFPDLAAKELKFIHSKKLETSTEPSSETLIEIPSQSNEINKNTNADYEEKIPIIPETESIRGKLVIENIPNDVSEDDIHSFLCGYGEIKSFSLEPVGGFLKAYVEIDLICDIDWIIECLNGTEPFGASTRLLKCYKQQ